MSDGGLLHFALGGITVSIVAFLFFRFVTQRRHEKDSDQTVLEKVRRRTRELESLHHASLSLTSSLELQPVLDTILEQTLKLVTADDAHIFLYDGENLTFGAARWRGDVLQESFSEPRTDGITYTVARSGKPIVISDVNQHELFKEWQWGGAIVGLPLLTGARVVGVMNVALLKPYQFDDAELRILELLADQAAIAIQNAHFYETSEAERQRIQLLYDVGQELARTRDPSEILQKAVMLTCKSLDAVSCEAFLVEPGSDRLRVRASTRSDGLSATDLDARIDMRFGKGLMGWVAKNVQPVLVSDVNKDDRWLEIPGVDEGVHSAVCAPVLADEEILGVIGVFHCDVGAYQEEHVDLLVTICRQIGLALSNVNRYQLIERRLTEHTLLRQVAQVVNRRLEMKPLLQEVVHQVGEVLGYPVVEIYLVDEDALVLGAACGGIMDEETRLPLTKGVIGRALRTAKPAYVPDVSVDLDYYVTWPETQSEIAIPLRKEDVVIGVLNVESPVRGGLTPEDTRLLSLLADQISIAVENAALYERLRHHAVELEQTVAERTAELADALKKAREADKMKTLFVSDVSHELRTPLSNILLYLELLASRKTDRDDTYFMTLNRETKRLIVLIEDLLTVSRLDAGTVSLEPSDVNLNSIARNLVEDRRQLFAEQELMIDIRLLEELPHVKVDERMLSQVVANLMTNAMHYTPPGGQITISTLVQSAQDRQWVTLTVADTGLGISQEDQKRIFQRFFRGSASREMGNPGTGLGLAICKEIIDRHYGRITVDSQLGNGSSFVIWLPLDRTGATDISI